MQNMHVTCYLYKVIILLTITVTLIDSFVQKETCDLSYTRSIYLQLGERGNVLFDNNILHRTSVFSSCIELVTCPFCFIKLRFENTTLSNNCKTENNATNLKQCHCGNITIWETTNHEKPTVLCLPLDSMIYKSFSRSLTIFYNVPFNTSKKFRMEYISLKNQNIINGYVGDSGIITSLNFPSLYPRDYGTEHVLYCKDKDCIIALLFTDFLISPLSLMEIFDSDGQLIKLVSGSKTRPPIIFSTGSSIVARFFGNGGSSLGYKAVYEFKNSSTQNLLNTDCGGDISDLGGYISMNTISGIYDCYWIIKPAGSVAFLKTHLYMKVINFTANGEIAVHKGITSESSIIDYLSNNDTNYTEYISPISKGFYIYLRGNFDLSSKLLIAYSAFSYTNCLQGLDYRCTNNRCIIQPLLCNNIDNCGDDSDEIYGCLSDIFNGINRFWWPSRNNDVENFGETKFFGGLWMCVMFLACTAFILVVAICRRTIKARPLNHIDSVTTNDQIQTITQLLAVEELIEQDDPPTYEPPPDYNQAMKPIQQKRRKTSIRVKNKNRHGDEGTSQLSPKLQVIAEPLTGLKRNDNLLNENIITGRSTSDGSLPMSLDMGYDEQETGISLSLSIATNNEYESQRIFPWMIKTESKSNTDNVTPSRLSAISFDTLRSSQEGAIDTITQSIVRCHSHDNISNVYNNFNSNSNFMPNQ